MNLTQIIEKAEGEFDKLWAEDDMPRGRAFAKSFLSEKIKEAYKQGWQDACVQGRKVTTN